MVTGVNNVCTCPHCGSSFELSPSEHDSLVAQIRTKEFEDEVNRRMDAYKKEQESVFEDRIAAAVGKAVLDSELQHTRVVGELNSKIESLEHQLISEKQSFELMKKDNDLVVVRAVDAKEKELHGTIHELEVQLSYYKDLKSRMSTKMVGETLEQHCMMQFNQIRMAAFPHAYFEKDNDARSGSKGDFIFRESDGDVELLSIMFEMKNEMDTTATKHCNEDFFKELDKDRREKGCEYAILVSMLESNSELYNSGIVDVSYRYPKMYVIRPQFFIPMITILRNAAMNAMEARQELLRVQNRNIDVVHFEEKLQSFKDTVSKNYDLASRQFDTAIDEIDKSIDHLTKVKKALSSASRNLRLMNDKSASLSIRDLTKDNPTMRNLLQQAGISI